MVAMRAATRCAPDAHTLSVCAGPMDAADRYQLSVEAAERNDLVRADYMYRMNSNLLASQLVFLDETSVDSRTPTKRSGYSIIGRRARHRAPFIRGERFTLTAAICTEGILTFDIVQGSSTAENFANFCATDLVGPLAAGRSGMWTYATAADGLAVLRAAARRQVLLMSPYPGPNSVLVMDNCSIHHNAAALQLLVAAGIRVEFLPPYSPDLNPVRRAQSALSPGA